MCHQLLDPFLARPHVVVGDEGESDEGRRGHRADADPGQVLGRDGVVPLLVICIECAVIAHIEEFFVLGVMFHDCSRKGHSRPEARENSFWQQLLLLLLLLNCTRDY